MAFTVTAGGAALLLAGMPHGTAHIVGSYDLDRSAGIRTNV